MNQINSVFVIGESRTNSDNAITKNYGTFYMAFEVDDLTSEVLDFSFWISFAKISFAS